MPYSLSAGLQMQNPVSVHAGRGIQDEFIEIIQYLSFGHFIGKHLGCC